MEAVSRLPREAFRYWPSGNQVLIGSGRFAQRLIFHRQTYKPEEESAIEALINRIEPSNVSRADLLRVLYAANWDIDRAAKQLEALLIWPKWVQSRTLPPSLLSAILDSGGIYTHGKDCFYRPLVVLVPSVLLQLPYSIDEIMHAAAYFFTFIEQKMLLPGQIESWVLMLDCAGAVTCPAVLNLKLILDAFLGGFPCRLAYGFLLNMHSNRGLWERITSTLPIETTEKFQEIREFHSLYKTINPSQLERCYGGTAEDVLIYWPPVFSSPIYRAEEAVELGEYSSFAEYFPEAVLEPEDSGVSSIHFPETSSKLSLNLTDPFNLGCGLSGDLQTIQESTNANVESSVETVTLATQLNTHQLRVNRVMDWRPRAEIAVGEEEIEGEGGVCACSSSCQLA